ncbi:hypothetical protein COBT_002328, partial [Conglomerata obtusa]
GFVKLTNSRKIIPCTVKKRKKTLIMLIYQYVDDRFTLYIDFWRGYTGACDYVREHNF